ncbi:MAG: hypothetical protein IBX72_11465 [Nitrospirae bacterium]|nr:hypothetical protein [Nitrospirota bacterium]
MRKQILIAGLVISLVALPCMVEAGTLFHATKKAIARKIAARGFSVKLMSPKARFGKGAYLSRSKATAIREKPKAEALVVFRDTKKLKNNAISVKDMRKSRIKAISGDKDLRGNIRYGIIGPNLGKKIGKNAAHKGKSVFYKSARDPRGTNVFIPAKVYQRDPKIVRQTGKIYDVR